MLCSKQDPGASVLFCPHPKQSFTVVAQFVLTALSEDEEPLLERELRQREIQTDLPQVTLRSLELNLYL